MKYVNNLNGKEANIITDKDITVTRQETGNSNNLSDILASQDRDIQALKQNIKWIYKYGGVGGGGSSESSVKVVFKKGDTIYKAGDKISLTAKGTQTFSIQIYGGGSDTFSVYYSYTNTTGTKTGTIILSMNNGFYSSFACIMDLNTTYSMTIVNQSTGDLVGDTFTNQIIADPYNFELYFIRKSTRGTVNESPIIYSDGAIFMSDVKDDPIMAVLEYNIAIDIQSATSRLKFTNWEQTQTDNEGCFSKGSGKIYLDLASDINSFLNDNGNAATRTISAEIFIMQNNSTVMEDVNPLILTNTLIPAGLYLKVVSSNTITTDAAHIFTDNEKYYTGDIVFSCTPYYGGEDKTKIYPISVYVNDVAITDLNITSLTDRTPSNIKLTFNDPGTYKVTFKLQYGSVDPYIISYYVCVKNVVSVYNWDTLLNPESSKSLYFRDINHCNISTLSGRTYFEMTSKSDNKIISLSAANTGETPNTFDILLALGIQYKDNNDTNLPICRLTTKSGEDARDLIVYQNKIVQVDSDDNVIYSTEVYIPKEMDYDVSEPTKYNLIHMYAGLQAYGSNTYYKSLASYVNGVMDGVSSDFITMTPNYKSITFYAGNYSINLLDYSRFEHTSAEQEEGYYKLSDFNYYWYCFKELKRMEQLTSSESQLYSYFSALTVNENCMVDCGNTDNIIQNIAKYSNIPVLYLHYSSDGETVLNPLDQYGDKFLEFMQKTDYAESETDDLRIPVTVSYSKGGGNTNYITYTVNEDDGNGSTIANTYNHIFYITLQGSSTMTYRSKNFELFAPNNPEEEQQYVYTPNFLASDYETFLPEKSFTLKADVVDSGHANNDVMGKFINKNTTKFADAQQNGVSHKCNAFTKNCLTGFPILLFLETEYFLDAQKNKKTDRYFLGIYNFNLGRQSYFNLGYYDLTPLDNIYNTKLMGNAGNFSVFSIPETVGYNNKITVAEIQGNNPLFDFSQFQSSVLFGINDSDTTKMYGDKVIYNGRTDTWQTSLTNFTKRIANAGGRIFDLLGKPMSEVDTDQYGYEASYSSKTSFPNYKHQITRSSDGTSVTYAYSDNTPDEDALLYITGDEEKEINSVLDYTSLAEYYTTCMAFGLVDSVQKNMNVKSWNGEKFYLAFYDMDTCMGISNSGTYINYFAFSDYWESSVTTDKNTQKKTLGQTTVYRDYAPVIQIDSAVEEGEEENDVTTLGYFDTPSSYMFGIAKYLAMFEQDDAEIVKTTPANIWAKWRRRRTYIDNDVEKEMQTPGCIPSAKDFMKQYYKEYVKNIPDIAYNYNYATKYLIRTAGTTNGYKQYDWKKMHGRRLYYIEEWLNNRFHLLDAYFNMNCISENVTLNTTPATSAVYPTPSTTTPVAYIDSLNEDISVLREVFSDSTLGAQRSNLNITAEVSAPTNSPLIIKTPNAQFRYIFPNQDKYTFTFKTNSNQICLFGGSRDWYSISSVLPFIDSNKLSLISDNLTEINGANNYQYPCSTIDLQTPNIKTLTLTGSKYTGTLNLNKEHSQLKTVNISNSGITLNSDECLFTSVTLTGKTGGSVAIKNNRALTTIEGLTSSSTVINTLEIPAYKSSISIDYIKCSKITISNTGKSYTATIQNVSNLTEVNLQSGCTSVTIYNCPNLKKITCANPSTITYISVRYCSSSSNELTFNSETTNTIDLSQFTNLSNINFYNTQGFNKLIVAPTLCNVAQKGFYNCKAFETIAITTNNPGNLVLTDSSSSHGTFENCRLTNIRVKNHLSIPVLKLGSSVTDISRTFYGNNLTAADAKFFNQEVVGVNNNIANISYLYANNNISYSSASSQSTTCDMTLGMYTKVTNAAYCYCNNSITTLNKFFFRYVIAGIKYTLGSNGTGVNLNNVIGRTNNLSQTITMPINVFQYITPYVTNNGMIDTYYSQRYKIVNADFSTLENDEVFLHDLWCPMSDDEIPVRQIPTKLTSLSNFDFNSSHKFDFTGFNVKWDSLQSINKVFGYTEISESKITNLVDSNGYFFTYYIMNNGKSKSLYYSLHINNPNMPIALTKKFKWDDLITNASGNISSWLYGAEGTQLYTYTLNFQEIKNIMQMVANNTNITGIDALFQNCKIITDSTVSFDFNFESTNNNLKTLRGTFKNFQHVLSSGEEGYITLTENTFKSFTKVTSLYRTFEGCKIEGCLPYDFFHKRFMNMNYTIPKDVSSAEYFADIENTIPVNIVSYDYNKDISEMYNCFFNVKWKELTSFTPNTTLAPSKIYAANNTTYTKYYAKNSTRQSTVIESTEISDIDNIEVAYIAAKPIVNSQGVVNPTVPTTYYTQSDGKYYGKAMLPPDILYGCTTNCNIQGCFYSYYNGSITNSLLGYMPLHLLKNITSTSSLANTFGNAYVIPVWFKTDTVGSATDKKYVFIPEGFTTVADLTAAFNIVWCIPTNYEQSGTNQEFYLLLDKSVPDVVTSYKYAFPNIGASSTSANRNYPIHYNLMYSTTDSTDGLIVTSNTECRNMISSDRIFICYYGHIFNPSVDLSQIKVSSDIYTDGSDKVGTYYAIYMDNYFDGWTGWNKYIIFPKATKSAISKNYLIHSGNSGVTKIKIGTNRVEGFDDVNLTSLLTWYNQSLSNIEFGTSSDYNE